MPAAEIVTTSLKIPQILSVTTDVRCSSANSELVMQNANIPGNSSREIPAKTPFSAVSVAIPAPSAEKPSMGIARMAKLRNMMGARKKMELKGFPVAGFRRRRICVSAQRKPEKKAEEMIRVKPRALKAVSPATIMMTPMVMVAMMRMSLREGVSRWKMKAKRRTKARAEDLHIAGEKRGKGLVAEKREGVGGRDVLKNVRVMNLRDIFPRPMSSPVAAPQGAMRLR